MWKKWKKFWNEELGITSVEIILILKNLIYHRWMVLLLALNHWTMKF